MAITIGQVEALTVKGIDTQGGLKDAVFKNNAYLERLRKNEGVFEGTKKTFPFNYFDSTQTTGSYYQGAEALTYDVYDSLTELAFNLIELEESIMISHRDIALNSGKAAAMNLVKTKLEIAEKAMRERFTKGIFSDGTSGTGALSAKQFVGSRAFLKSSSVNYGGVTSTDVAAHVAYVNSNGGTLRALTTAIHQDVLGGASEGNEKPTLGVMKQNVMNVFVELLKPHQRTTRESTLDGLGHEKNTLVYSGVDHIVDNLAIANAIQFFNEKFVRLYAVPEYNMKRMKIDNMESKDAMLQRIFYKGAYACSVLRYQGLASDLAIA
jgi:hypothetical protein